MTVALGMRTMVDVVSSARRTPRGTVFDHTTDAPDGPFGFRDERLR